MSASAKYAKGAQVDERSVYSYDTREEQSLYGGHGYESPWSSMQSTSKDTHQARPKYPQYPSAYSDDAYQAQVRTYEPALTIKNEDEYSAQRGRTSGVLQRASSRWRKPWFCWFVSIVQVAVFVAQCGHAWHLTGSPIQIKPSFNVMIGPSVYNSINMGARYTYCMKFVGNVTDIVTGWPCPNATTTAQLSACTLAELCGNGARDDAQPRQWFRFIVPIFLHAGLLHIFFNLVVQLRQGTQIEVEIGTHLFIPIYLSAGIGGYLFGGNFAGSGIASTGASGSIFSIISLSLLQHLYRWKQIESPRKGLALLLFDVTISLALGLLPGVDNFSHIGGFLIGLLLGVALLRSPDALDRRPRLYEQVGGFRMSTLDKDGQDSGSGHDRINHDARDGRTIAWWAFGVLRLICLGITVMCITLLVKVTHMLRHHTS